MEGIFHRPSDLMRLTMLTRDIKSLLHPHLNGQQESQQMNVSD
jgi:hypothetical protein